MARRARVAMVSTLAVAGVLGSIGTTAPAMPGIRGLKHCGLLRASREWVDSPHIKGYLYDYTQAHIGCKAHAREAMRVAVLAIDGNARPLGYTCMVAAPLPDGGRTNSGYCTKGSPKKPTKLKFVEFAPETDCPIIDPPYTPAHLPRKCHT